MQFSITVIITTTKKGLDLDAEYDRLGFSEDNRGSSFRTHRDMPVSKSWAKTHEGLFRIRTTATIKADLSLVNKEDFEDWGAHGMVLSDMAHERIDELLPHARIIL